MKKISFVVIFFGILSSGTYSHAQTKADPTLLPKATGQVWTSSTPGANTAGGNYYVDPTSSMRVWRATSPTYPCASNTGESHHDYGDVTQISREWGSGFHTLLIQTCGSYRLVDFKRGVGFSNWRTFTSGGGPSSDLHFTFSNNPATPQIAYSLNNSNLVRYNTATNQVENTGNYPKSNWTSGPWLQNDVNDEWFVAINSSKTTATAWNSKTNQTLSATPQPGFDEPHLTNDGRYVLLHLGDTGAIWDIQTNIVRSFSPPAGRLGHPSSPTGFITTVDVDSGGGITPHYRMDPATGQGVRIHDFGGYKPDYHHSGSWVHQSGLLTSQWFLISTYGSFNGGVLNNAVGLMRLDGSDVRFLAHTFEENGDYWQTPRATIAVDGKLAMFDSNMRGSRGDVFVVELPISGSTTQPPPPPPPPGGAVPGDINLDRIVNSLDWSIMSSNWLSNHPASDVNKDGLVNSLDFSLMSSNWLRTW